MLGLSTNDAAVPHISSTASLLVQGIIYPKLCARMPSCSEMNWVVRVSPLKSQSCTDVQ